MWGVIVNIRQLQYFYLAACCGSFSEAARAESVSVQAVSKAMLDLEEEVGAPLFVRGGRTVKLTPLGKSLVGPAREAVASFDAFGRAVELRTQAETGKKQADVRLALISPPFAKHELVCNAFSQLISHMAGIKTQLKLAMGTQALADLRAGNIDAMITIGAFSDPRCSCLVLGTVSVGAFMGKSHPLRRKRLLTFADLERYPVLYNEEIDSFNETILSSCRKRGLASPLISVDTDEGVAEFLEQRDGYVLGVHLKALDIKPPGHHASRGPLGCAACADMHGDAEGPPERGDRSSQPIRPQRVPVHETRALKHVEAPDMADAKENGLEARASRPFALPLLAAISGDGNR